MSDDEKPVLATPGLKLPVRQPKPGELLFEFYVERTHRFMRCELRDHGQYGVEAQFLEADGWLRLAQTFRDVLDGDRLIKARESAIAWAEDERKAMTTERL